VVGILAWIAAIVIIVVQAVAVAGSAAAVQNSRSFSQ
jgi:hypothetical protein